MHGVSEFKHDVLIVPGLHGSGSDHWQTLWERTQPKFRRVEQSSWVSRDLDTWTGAVDRAIDSCTRPALLVAHSFGCLAAVRRVMVDATNVAGLLLVAPADPRRYSVMPEVPLTVPAMVVVGSDDPCTPFEISQAWAERIGGRFVNIGEAGHINPESGFGPWPYGWHLLNKLEVMAGASWYPVPSIPPDRPGVPERPPVRPATSRAERTKHSGRTLACLGLD